MKLKGDDQKFVDRIKRTIEEGTYDDLNMDEWEVIETLLDLIEHYTKD